MLCTRALGVIEASNKPHSIIVEEKIFPRQRSKEGRCVCANLRDELEQFWPDAIFVHEFFYPWPNQKKKGEDCTMFALVQADMVRWMISNFVQNTPLRVIFSSLFSVFEYPDEMLSLLFDILCLTYFDRIFFTFVWVRVWVCCTEVFWGFKGYVLSRKT